MVVGKVVKKLLMWEVVLKGFVVGGGGDCGGVVVW